jgi:hypothetical protein
MDVSFSAFSGWGTDGGRQDTSTPLPPPPPPPPKKNKKIKTTHTYTHHSQNKMIGTAIYPFRRPKIKETPMLNT